MDMSRSAPPTTNRRKKISIINRGQKQLLVFDGRFSEASLPSVKNRPGKQLLDLSGRSSNSSSNRVKERPGQRGVSLYLTVFVMIVILGIALGLSSTLFTQLELIGGIDDSLIAFYAAEAGVERQLYEGTLPPPVVNYTGTLSNGASYEVQVFVRGEGECQGADFCIESTGSHQQAQRAVWVER